MIKALLRSLRRDIQDRKVSSGFLERLSSCIEDVNDLEHVADREISDRNFGVGNRRHFRLLNSLDSEAWLISQTLRAMLGGFSVENRDYIAKKILDVEEIRKSHESELRRLKEKYSRLQSAYEQVSHRVRKSSVDDELIKLFQGYVQGKFPDEVYVKALLQKIDSRIAILGTDSNNLYKLKKVISWVVDSYSDPSYYPRIRAYKNKEVFHIPEGCASYPDTVQIATRGEESIAFFESIELENGTYVATNNDGKRYRLCQACARNTSVDERVLEKYLKKKKRG